MKTTLSIIKADVGGIGGRVTLGTRLIEAVRAYVRYAGDGLLTDFFVSATGDEIAILMTHARGTGDPDVHRLAWDAFKTGTAKEQGLYGAAPRLPRLPRPGMLVPWTTWNWSRRCSSSRPTAFTLMGMPATVANGNARLR
jgi:hypothetical protein